MSKWVVLSGGPDGGVTNALLVEAETDTEAAAIAFEDFHELDPDCLPSTAYVMPVTEGRYVSASYGAEAVPEEFQCCGGMPRLSMLGTENQHCANCERSHALEAIR